MRIESGGKIAHAQIRIGNYHFKISDEHPEAGALSPKSRGGLPVRTYLYVRDADSFVGRAVAIGATLRQMVDEQIHGDRSGSLEDPFGHIWHIASHRDSASAHAIQQFTEFPADRAGTGLAAVTR